MMYRTCPHCGANLDPGEICDCLEIAEGRPAATGATLMRKELPFAVYQSMAQMSSCGGSRTSKMKGAAT